MDAAQLAAVQAFLAARPALPRGWALHHRCHDIVCYELEHLEAMARGDNAAERFETEEATA